jgi:hypothetical protein
MSERPDPDFSFHHKDHEYRGNNGNEPQHSKNGNLGVTDKNPNDQRRIEEHHERRQHAQKQPRLLVRLPAIPAALWAIRFAHGVCSGHVALRTFGSRHGVTIFRLEAVVLWRRRLAGEFLIFPMRKNAGGTPAPHGINSQFHGKT